MKVALDKPKTIDEWLDQLEAATGLWIVHSSGTTGKLSFLPRGSDDLENHKNVSHLLVYSLQLLL